MGPFYAEAGRMTGMYKVQSGDATISFTESGKGPTLVLVHGGFSDHENFWRLVRPALERRFTLVSIARRGHGESSKTNHHTAEDEARDVVAVIDAVGTDVYLLAHSGGSFCALIAASQCPRVKRLILYEPPGPDFHPAPVRAQIYQAAAQEDWDRVVELFVGEQVAAALKPTPFFATMTGNAEATMASSEDVERYWSEPDRAERFRGVSIPVLLLTGSETGDERHETGALARVLPDNRVAVLEGQGHAAMLTAPALFVQEIEAFLLGE
jgi:pimeloyl-ACP methyl ester carboxylesterase